MSAATDPMFQGQSVQKLHRDERPTVVLADLVNSANVRVVQRGSGTSLAAESFKCIGIVRDTFGQDLQGNEASNLRVFGFVNDTHPATAEFLDDAVVGDSLPDHWAEILWLGVWRVN